MPPAASLVKDGDPVIPVIEITIIHHENAKGRKDERNYNNDVPHFCSFYLITG